MSRLMLATVFVVMGFVWSAQAGMPDMGPVSVKKSSEETIFSIGLRFSFGDMVPKVVGGVRRTTTDKSSDVTGFQADVAVPLTPDAFMKPEVRVLGLAGDRDALGQAGVGFDFGSGQAFVSGGVQGPNVEGGVNVGLGGKFDPYLGANTFGRPSGPKNKTIMILPPSYM